MTWKTELRLDDLPPHSRLEAFCKTCSAARYSGETEAFQGGMP